jgi:hypothetical protein
LTALLISTGFSFVAHHETFALLVCWYAAVEPGIGSRL